MLLSLPEAQISSEFIFKICSNIFITKSLQDDFTNIIHFPVTIICLWRWDLKMHSRKGSCISLICFTFSDVLSWYVLHLFRLVDIGLENLRNDTVEWQMAYSGWFNVDNNIGLSKLLFYLQYLLYKIFDVFHLLWIVKIPPYWFPRLSEIQTVCLFLLQSIPTPIIVFICSPKILFGLRVFLSPLNGIFYKALSPSISSDSSTFVISTAPPSGRIVAWGYIETVEQQHVVSGKR